MAVEIHVGGVDRSDQRLAGSALTWSDQINGRGTLAITFRDVYDGWRPEDGEELLVLAAAPNTLVTAEGDGIQTSDLAGILTGPDRLFGGFLVNPVEREELGSNYLFFECSAVEFSALCDRRIVNRVYEATAVDDIVRDIVLQDLDGEGLLVSEVIDGPTIEKAVFSDVTVTEAFNELAELVGYDWRIDAYKVVHFGPRDALLGPDLDGNVALAGSVTVRRSTEKYRNVQIVRAGTDLTDSRAEILVGDGQRRVFATAFPLGAVPTVEESRAGGAWTEKTLGILGIDSGKDWYWNSGQSQVSQDDGGTLLIAPTTIADPETGDRVRVTYRGLFPVKTQYQDLEEITARQALEGGSGIHANVEDRPQINSAQSALDAAVALIQRHGRVSPALECRTRLEEFLPGQLVEVTFPRHDLVAEEMLVDSVSAEYSDEDGQVWYTVRALSGDTFGGWQDYFRKLLRAGKALVVGREGEVLVLTRSAAAGATASDLVDVDDTVAPESRIGIMNVGTGEIGV